MYKDSQIELIMGEITYYWQRLENVSQIPNINLNNYTGYYSKILRIENSKPLICKITLLILRIGL